MAKPNTPSGQKNDSAVHLLKVRVRDKTGVKEATLGELPKLDLQTKGAETKKPTFTPSAAKSKETSAPFGET